MTRVLVGLAVVLVLAEAAEAGDTDRIRAHLIGALDQLRVRDITALPPAQRDLRARSIRSLERYIARGEFPRRTGDPYAGLRPRFIDDRGVHCAVGYLIAESGAPELARAINAEYEYAFVREMHSPALLAWATEHGFSVEELARIQPTYAAPPTADSMRHEIELEKGDFILACAGTDVPPTKLTLRIAGDDDGVVKVTATSGSAFARCFADKASQLERGGGAHSPSPEAFRANMTVELPTPQRLLEKWLVERTGYGPDCTPRPGAVPTQATLSIETASEGVAVTVTTRPSNREVDRCIENYLRPKLHPFHHHIKLSKQLPLAPRVTSRRVESLLRQYSSQYATDCYAAEAPARVQIRASARRDDKQFTLAIEGANETFASCVVDKLHETLRTKLSVPREHDGKITPYFRIDSNVKASLTFAIETPAQRDIRVEKARKENARRLREIKELIDRPYYDL